MSKVYVHENRSILTISRFRILLLIPMILYGFYKNGVFLYRKGYIKFNEMFNPFLILILGIIIGAIVNIIYEYIFKRSKDKFVDVLFSSFHIEYGIVLACIMSFNINIYIFLTVTFIMFLLSKFLNNRINIVSLTFLVIYFVSLFFTPLNFINPYENDKILSLTFFDYLIGRGVGGIFSTNSLLLFVGLIILSVTDNIKIKISYMTFIFYLLIALIGLLVFNQDFKTIIFYPSFIFALTFISTDSVTSPITNGGILLYGILISIITYLLTFVNPVIAPFVAISIISLFNSLIDRFVSHICKVFHFKS